jgi:hypothetical protein
VTDRFTRCCLDLARAILRDPGVRPFAARLGVHILLGYANREAFASNGVIEAWPSQERLAEELGGTVEAVRRARSDLAPYVTVTPGKGRGHNSRYRFAMSEGTGKAQLNAGVSRRKTPRSRPVLESENPQRGTAETPNRKPDKTPPDPATNCLSEPSEERSESDGDIFRAPEVADGTKRSRRKASTPLPVGCPSDHDLTWATGKLEQTRVAIDLNAERERFRDYHLARDSRFTDWSAAWRTWVGNAIRWGAQRAGQSRPHHQQPRSPLDWAIEGLDK